MELVEIESVDPPPYVRRMWIEWTGGMHGDLRPRVAARYVDPKGMLDTLSMVWRWRGLREVESYVYCATPYRCIVLSDLTNSYIKPGKEAYLEFKHFIALTRFKGVGRELMNWYLSHLSYRPL